MKLSNRALLVIDNTPLRTREILEAKRWLKKIRKLEDAIQSFHNNDQWLFSEWHDLTFRDLTAEIATKRDEYLTLADFHNQMVMLAERQKISLPQAFRILFEEEQEYAQADAELRAKIDERREQRKVDLQREIEKEMHAECDCAKCRRQRQGKPKETDEPLDRFGMNFDEMFGDSEEADFDEELKPTKKSSHRESALGEDHRLQLKAIYRQIVRRIHPDHLEQTVLVEQKASIDSLWKNAVQAHQRKDLAALLKVHYQILAFFEEFDSLSLSELRSVVASVQDEFKAMEHETKNIKTSLAWNFSKLKDYSKLKVKIARPFRQQLEELGEEIDQMREQRRYLEYLLKAGSIRRKYEKSTRRRPIRKPRSRRTTNRQQTSFEI
jgi:hypothetical protein